MPPMYRGKPSRVIYGSADRKSGTAFRSTLVPPYVSGLQGQAGESEKSGRAFENMERLRQAKRLGTAQAKRKLEIIQKNA